ncbi:MAG: AAA family ATPase [Thiotrichaceae bacterium]|nr:AAA family ATPase [Thiotrichaceae bacterium]PCI11402.1 MAG: aminoglycoside phosphotransferase [Thiotrichales bacterium]
MKPPLLIMALQNQVIYDHPVSEFTLIETHCAWVLLTGDYAYKIKKPLNLGFLDFSTLEKRRHVCEEEIRLNRRLADEIYLDVVAITGSIDAPQLNGNGEVIEYAVKMRQFETGMEFDQLIKQGKLTNRHVDQLATRVASFHQSLKGASNETPYGSMDAIRQPMLDNFSEIDAALSDNIERQSLAQLQQWTTDELTRLTPMLENRKRDGFIRECHGDLHLANVTRYHHQTMLFDCLEFNPKLRWIDQISDIAFMVMDLDAHGKSDFGFRFLNAWLQQSGDYAAVPLLRLYLVYRAMVRAKVALIQHAQHPGSGHSEQCQRYLNLALSYTAAHATPLMITHGLSGSGKSCLSQLILEQLGAIRLRSDVERKRLHGLSADARSQSAVGRKLYSATSSDATYQRLATIAQEITVGGYPVIIDATFLKQAQRQQFKAVAKGLKVPFIILHFHAEEALLRQWIIERNEKREDPSEAGISVLEHQIRTQEPLNEDERLNTVTIDSGKEVDISLACKNITNVARAEL